MMSATHASIGVAKYQSMPNLVEEHEEVAVNTHDKTTNKRQLIKQRNKAQYVDSNTTTPSLLHQNHSRKRKGNK